MISPVPVTLEANGVRLEPLSQSHHDALIAAARDGELWKLWFTWVPAPEGMDVYLSKAAKGTQEGSMLPWAVREPRRGPFPR